MESLVDEGKVKMQKRRDHLRVEGLITRAWKEDTEKPRRPMESLVEREATERRGFGLGSSSPCRLHK